MSQLKQYTVRVMETFQLNVTAESQEEAREIIAKEVPKHNHAGFIGNHQRRHTFARTLYVTPSGKLSEQDPDELKRLSAYWRKRLDDAQYDLEKAESLGAPSYILAKYENQVERHWETLQNFQERLSDWECV
jgi:hypothetical protein